MTFQNLLKQQFSSYGELSEPQLLCLEGHFALLNRWNKKLNLTRLDELEEAVKLHYCESLYLGTVLPAGTLRIADIGSGGGFPGIPIAILRPDCEMTLVESHNRKAVFLREAARGIPNIRVLSMRAELIEEEFDWLVCRAVTPREVLALDLAPQAALLVGKADAEAIGDPKRLPWGKDRYWVTVSRATTTQDVSRGTSGP